MPILVPLPERGEDRYPRGGDAGRGSGLSGRLPPALRSGPRAKSRPARPASPDRDHGAHVDPATVHRDLFEASARSASRRARRYFRLPDGTFAPKGLGRELIAKDPAERPFRVAREPDRRRGRAGQFRVPRLASQSEAAHKAEKIRSLTPSAEPRLVPPGVPLPGQPQNKADTWRVAVRVHPEGASKMRSKAQADTVRHLIGLDIGDQSFSFAGLDERGDAIIAAPHREFRVDVNGKVRSPLPPLLPQSQGQKARRPLAFIGRSGKAWVKMRKQPSPSWHVATKPDGTERYEKGPSRLDEEGLPHLLEALPDGTYVDWDRPNPRPLRLSRGDVEEISSLHDKLATYGYERALSERGVALTGVSTLSGEARPMQVATAPEFPLLKHEKAIAAVMGALWFVQADGDIVYDEAPIASDVPDKPAIVQQEQAHIMPADPRVAKAVRMVREWQQLDHDKAAWVQEHFEKAGAEYSKALRSYRKTLQETHFLTKARDLTPERRRASRTRLRKALTRMRNAQAKLNQAATAVHAELVENVRKAARAENAYKQERWAESEGGIPWIFRKLHHLGDMPDPDLDPDDPASVTPQPPRQLPDVDIPPIGGVRPEVHEQPRTKLHEPLAARLPQSQGKSLPGISGGDPNHGFDLVKTKSGYYTDRVSAERFRIPLAAEQSQGKPDTPQQKMALRKNKAARRVRKLYPAGTRIESFKGGSTLRTMHEGERIMGGTVVRHIPGLNAQGGVLVVKWDNGVTGRITPINVRREHA